MHKVQLLLAAGGVFAGSVPNYARPRYRHGQDLGISSVPPVHLNFWTPSALVATLGTAGFSKIEIVVPRILRPFRPFNLTRVSRFIRVALGYDTPTAMFFVASKQ
jgi:hypothetical protein